MPPPTYPPYQQPILDPATGRVTQPWQLFFLSLVSAAGVVGAIPPGSLPVDRLADIAASRLLGRGSTSGAGPPQEITLGTGLTMTGTTLSASGGGSTWADGYWTPITNGDPVSPEILFDSTGACIVGFVPTP